MKKLFLLLFVLANLAAAHSQTNEVKSPKKNLLFGLYYSPDLNRFTPYLKPYFSSTYGLNLEFEIDQMTSLTFGLMYSFRSHYPNTVAYGIFTRQTLNLLEAPVTLRYKFLNEEHKIRPFLSTGLVPVIKLYGEDTYTDYDGENERIYKRDKIKVQYILFNISAGADFNFSDKLKISFEPFLRLDPLSKVEGSKLPTSVLVKKVGLAATMFYKL